MEDVVELHPSVYDESELVEAMSATRVTTPLPLPPTSQAWYLEESESLKERDADCHEEEHMSISTREETPSSPLEEGQEFSTQTPEEGECTVEETPGRRQRPMMKKKNFYNRVFSNDLLKYQKVCIIDLQMAVVNDVYKPLEVCIHEVYINGKRRSWTSVNTKHFAIVNNFYMDKLSDKDLRLNAFLYENVNGLPLRPSESIFFKEYCDRMCLNIIPESELIDQLLWYKRNFDAFIVRGRQKEKYLKTLGIRNIVKFNRYFPKDQQDILDCPLHQVVNCKRGLRCAKINVFYIANRLASMGIWNHRRC
ncbi:LbFV_orf94-like [Cotesia congregata filamentous virus 1]|uniref:LbFV_orf94-like n=1 Tax=Cotesia congregata filamentous virus 1 TaxID=3064291 RepID=A0ABC8QJK0_9VIRU|nr:LbFV_orf94-like [Cotesia congregata filamentous virus 1]